MNPFMRAHGSQPGPTQRPILTGTLSGLIALAPTIALTWSTGVLMPLGRILRTGPIGAVILIAAVALIGGAVYGRIFMRAANDRRGSWLFGLGYGFLVWLAGVGAIAPLFMSAPLVTGRTSQFLFAAHLLYGLVLGAVFPWIHLLIQRESPWKTPHQAQ